MGKDLVLATPSLEEDLRIPPHKEDDDEEAPVAEVRREYASKLEQVGTYLSVRFKMFCKCLADYALWFLIDIVIIVTEPHGERFTPWKI